MRLVLYQPDIPQNTGTLLRLGACLGVPVDIIEPCGFLLDDRRLRRAGMDYIDHVSLTRHNSWQAYREAREKLELGQKTSAGRLLLLTTKGDMPYTAFQYRADDSLMLGRESAGVPDDVQEAADARLVIPMAAALRSINVAMAAAMVLGEALRQTDQFPEPTS